MSICDILFYTEISTITILSGQLLIPANTPLFDWFTKTMRCPEIDELDELLRKSIRGFRDAQANSYQTQSL